MIHTFELEIIRYIQQIRTPFFDGFFTLWHFFDRPEFFCVLIPAIWLIKGQKTGIKLFCLLLFSGSINALLKSLFASPRPFHIDPKLGLLSITGYGLPSGAAQTVMLLSALAFTSWKSSYKWALIFPYILLVSFARVYLGIHFPTDILAGWSVGVTLWICYRYFSPYLENKISKLSFSSKFLIFQTPLFLGIIFLRSVDNMYASVSALGIGLGVLLNQWLRWQLPPVFSRKEKIQRAFIGILGTFFCYKAFYFSPLIAFFSIGLWVSTGSLWVCKKIQKLQQV